MKIALFNQFSKIRVDFLSNVSFYDSFRMAERVNVYDNNQLFIDIARFHILHVFECLGFVQSRMRI